MQVIFRGVAFLDAPRYVTVQKVHGNVSESSQQQDTD